MKNASNAAEPLAGYPEVLTTAHVAEILGATRIHVQTLCREGKLPNVKVGQRVYIPKNKLIALLQLEGE